MKNTSSHNEETRITDSCAFSAFTPLIPERHGDIVDSVTTVVI
jgi:hypothetical protein